MDSLKDESSNVFQFNPDTLSTIRKSFDLDKPERLEEALNIIEEWIKKQDHFVDKDFSREYLERLLIINKGSIERVKTRLDKLCTLKTLMPELFKPLSMKNDFENIKDVQMFTMPKLTPDNLRIFIGIIESQKVTAKDLQDLSIKGAIACEFITRFDYCNGYILIYDYRNANLSGIINCMDLSLLRKCMTIIMDGYGIRVKAIHIICDSKLFDTLFNLVKPILSSKIADRVKIHNTLESLHEHVPAELLPAEYGGKEKSARELSREWEEAWSSNDKIDYLKKSFEKRTDESLRPVEKFNEQHLGTAGTFRTFVVD